MDFRLWTLDSRLPVPLPALKSVAEQAPAKGVELELDQQSLEFLFVGWLGFE